MSTDFYDNAVAVDPHDCGCTECSTGEYVNATTLIEYGSDELLMKLVNLELKNNMGSPWAYSCLREEAARKLGITVEEINFPDTTQIDPKGCGCTECGTGEYAEFFQFAAEAGEGDLRRLSEGQISCTYESADELIELIERRLGLNSWLYQD